MILKNPQPIDEIFYPETDGEPIAENTVQFDWIVLLKTGFDVEFLDDPLVFVAGDLLWYPVEGRPDICTAPDVMLAFGRPKGPRGSYLQWKEENIAPQVVFEVLSPSNTPSVMEKKRKHYEKYGVDEYYEFEPEKQILEGWIRIGSGFERIPNLNGWLSPRLQVRFDLSGEHLRVIGRHGKPFESLEEVARERNEAKRERDEITRERDEITRERDEITRERDEITRERDKVKQERDQETKARLEAEKRTEHEAKLRLLAEEQARETAARAERLAAKLRELGIEP